MADPASADSYSALERQFVTPFRRWLLLATRPLVDLLARLGVHPNALSVSQIPLGFVALALVPSHPRLAFLLFMLAVFVDGLDGALARATGTSSRFGALLDQYCDHTREITFVAGMALWGELAILPALAYGPIYVGLNLTLYLANVHHTPVPWSIKSYLVVYPALFTDLWLGLDILTSAVVLSEGLMLVVIAMGLRNLARST